MSNIRSDLNDATIMRLGLKVLTDEVTRVRPVSFRKVQPFETCEVPFWPEYLMSDDMDATMIDAPQSVAAMQREFAHRRERTTRRVPVVVDAVTSFPMTPVTLGRQTPLGGGKDPIVFHCHDVILDVILAQWQIPSCYSVKTLASSIANLDLHPHVIGTFLAMFYCDMSSYLRPVCVVTIASALAVLAELGVAESDKNYAILANRLEKEQKGHFHPAQHGASSPSQTSVIHWCVWVDRDCKHPILSALLVRSLLALRKDMLDTPLTFGEIKAIVVEAFPDWKPCERFFNTLAEIVFSNDLSSARASASRSTSIKEYQFKGVDWWQSSCVDYVREHVFGLKRPHVIERPRYTTALPPPDYAIVVSSANKTFHVHSWIMVQWPYFVRTIEAGLSEATDRTVELPSDMPLVVVEYLLAVLYGADPMSTLDTNAVMERMFPDGAMFLLRNASLYEMLAAEVGNAGRLQVINEFTCALLYRMLRQVETTFSVATPQNPKRETPSRRAHRRDPYNQSSGDESDDYFDRVLDGLAESSASGSDDGNDDPW